MSLFLALPGNTPALHQIRQLSEVEGTNGTGGARVHFMMSSETKTLGSWPERPVIVGRKREPVLPALVPT
jgi:hypothetical protein